MAAMEKIPVLVIDDEPFNLLAFKANFSRLYEVYLCSSIQEANKVLSSVKLKIIICDDVLRDTTGMRGLEYLELISESHPECIRIITTGKREMGDIEKAFEEKRIFAIIDKPWNLEQIRNILIDAEKTFEN